MFVGVSTALTAVRSVLKKFVRQGLKLYYRFSDTKPDFLLDGSTTFSGSSQYIDCGTGLGNVLGDNYAGDLTVSMWFKADVTSGDDGMFEIGNFTNSGTGDFALRMKSNTLSWMVNAVRRLDVSYTNTSSWSHVVGVYDSRGADFTKLYLNAESVGTPTGTFPSASDLDLNGLKTTIGGYYGSPYTFDGKIANVGIWNRALSASEVESIYWRGSHSELQNTELTNLVSWYDLQGDVLDKQGSNNGTNNGATLNTDSYSGESPFKPRIQDKATPKMAVQLADGSTSFDGADSYINCGSDSSLDNIWNGGGTLSAWIFPESDGEGDDGRIAEKRDTGDGWTFTTREQSGSSCKLRVFINFSSTNGVYTSGADVTINDWNHVAVAYDSSGAGSSYRPVIYINGSVSALSATTDSVGTADSDASEDFTIGGNKAQTRIFDGKIANVSVHSSSLTQSQIQELMFTEKYSGLSADLKTNLVSWYDLGSTSLGSELVDEDARTFDGTGTHSWGIYGSNTVSNVDNNLVVTYVSDDRGAKLVLSDANDLNSDLTAGITYQVTMNVKINTGDAVIRVYNGSNYESIGTIDSTSFTDVTGTFTAQSGTRTLNFDNMGSGEVITVNEFSIKEVQAPDSEGTNEGSIYGATTNTGYTHSPHGVVDPLNFGETYSGRALSFDGTNDSVNLGVVPNYSSASGSISIWIYSHNNSTPSLQGIVTNSSTGTDQHFLGIGSSKVRYSATNSSSIFTIFADSELVENQWTHVVATRSYDGANTTTKLYINGVLQTDSDTFSGSQVANSNNILIGHLNVDRYFDGELNNLKIFNTALTQDQVRELYTKPETVLPTGVSASNLKLDLPMQEKAGSIIYDGSGNQNHGTITGATFVTGEEYGYQASLVRSNTPIIFDGSNDFVSCGNIGIRNYPFTYSAWFRTNGTTKNTICALCDADQNVKFYQFLIADTGVARINARNTADDFCDSSGTYNDGKWHHGVAVFASATDRKIYIDGVADGSDTSSVAFDSGVDEFSIGVLNRSSKADYYDDDINEVAVWDVALDADAVSALYNSGVPLLPTSDSGNYDNSDSLMGYWRNDGKPTWTDRANTGVASFDGTDDYISMTDTNFPSGSSDRSISIWFSPNTTSTEQNLFHYGTDATAQRISILGNNTSVALGINGCKVGIESLSLANTFTNIVFIIKGHTDDTELYINGVSQSLSVLAGTAQSINTTLNGTAYIGRHYSATYWNGKVAGVNVFNTALTATEISELYAIDKRSSISGHSQFNNCVGSLLMGAGDGDSTSTIQDQTSNNNDGTVNGASLIGYNDGTASGSPVEILIPEGSTEGRDNQGYYLSDTTLISNGIRLFGSEYIEVKDSESLDFVGGFSIDCWVKPTDSGNGNQMILSKNNNTDGYRFQLTNSTKTIQALVEKDNNHASVTVNSTTALQNDTYYFISLTYDGAKSSGVTKLYVNGTLEATNTSGTGLDNTSLDLQIGRHLTSSYFSGNIDEVRFYDKELSASEVLKNYNSGKSSHQ